MDCARVFALSLFEAGRADLRGRGRPAGKSPTHAKVPVEAYRSHDLYAPLFLGLCGILLSSQSFVRAAPTDSGPSRSEIHRRRH